MTNPFRRMMPNPWLWRGPLIAALLWLMICFVFATGITTAFRGEIFNVWGFLVGIFLGGCFSILCFWLAALGLYRARAFDPLLRRDYYRWLAASPWTARKPLPNGPIHIVWQDAVVIGLACFAVYSVSLLVVPIRDILSAERDVTPLWVWPIIAFSAPYLAVRCFVYLMELRPVAYAMLGAILVALSFENIAIRLAGIGVCFVISYIGAWMLLARLEETFQVATKNPLQPITPDARQGPFNVFRLFGERPAIAWPHDMLSPMENKPRVRRWEGTVLSLLAGLLTNVVLSQGSWREPRHALLLGILAASCVCVTRFFVYFATTRPPISLSGRIFTFRWIIPRYDRAFLPIVFAVVLTAMARYYLWPFRGIHLRIIISLLVAVITWTALCWGPTLQEPFSGREAVHSSRICLFRAWHTLSHCILYTIVHCRNLSRIKNLWQTSDRLLMSA